MGGAKWTIISKIPIKARCIWIQERMEGANLYTNYSQIRERVLNATKGGLTTKEGMVLNSFRYFRSYKSFGSLTSNSNCLLCLLGPLGFIGLLGLLGLLCLLGL